MSLAALLAQTSPDNTASPLSSLVIFVPLILIFYFFVIRPQRRRIQEHQQLVGSIIVGDEVETVGGIYGVVKRIEDDVMWLEVSAGTSMKISRAAVRRKVPAADAS